jgi:hypothetical protein
LFLFLPLLFFIVSRRLPFRYISHLIVNTLLFQYRISNEENGN